uniref:Uncharacterized protein LOC102806930 n=1 Tax=Saccoglossus kowalevskii TaxID=10224 RepID=A0ABM0MT72_SACKO|nr:PREDICTED: uncharacterized protein LOC102806930 [Saccoglossus kowalevskii]
MGRDIDGNHTESNTHHDSAIITTVPTVTDHQTESIMSILLSTTSKYLVSCFQNVSLFNSKQEGEIATVPLTNIIKEEYPQFNWVAMLIQIFIMISITVSFLTIGSAMVHTLSGWLDSLWTQDHFISYAAVDVKRKCYCSSGKW